MEFSWFAFWITVTWKVAEGIMSYREGTFSLGQMMTFSMRRTLGERAPLKFHGEYCWQHLPMSFLNNWTVSIGDLYVFPIVNALVVPYSWAAWGSWNISAFLIIGVLVSLGILASVIFHQSWWGYDENLGHIFKNWNHGKGKEGGRPAYWVRDTTQAGWVHFWFMAFQVAVVLAYIITPMPRGVLFWVSLLFSGFVILQQLQGAFIQKRNSMRSLFNVMWQIVLIWAIAAFKF